MLSNMWGMISGVFKFHKRKILIFVGLTLILTYIFFPFNDLSDLVTSKVSELTSGQVFVGFDNLNLSLLPSPGLSLSNVFLEMPAVPPLKAKSITARPSIVGLLTFKPGIAIQAEDFLGGDLSLSTRGGDKNSIGKRKQKVDVDFSSLKLGEILSMLDLPVRVTGQAAGTFTSMIDLDMTDQPSGDVQLNLSKVVMDETDLNLQGMPLSLPKVSLNQVDMEGHLDKGSLEITHLNVGKPGQDLSAQVSGHMNLQFVKQGQSVNAIPTNYEFYVKLQVGESLKQKIGPYLGILQSYMVAQNTYSIKLSGPNFYAVPNMVKGP